MDTLNAVLFATGLFCGMLACLEVGRWLGRRATSRTGQPPAGLGTVEAVSFALLGLLLALTFTGAAARFETKRGLVVEEANAIGTAWLRIDVLPPQAQPKLRDSFRKYVDLRLDVYRTLAADGDLPAATERVTAVQNEIWADVVAATRDGASAAAVVVLPAVNAMFDIRTTRNESRRTHPPGMIYVLLAIISLLCGLLAGYQMGASVARSWVHTITFALILALTVYLILDLEYPRRGLIRLDPFDKVLVDLRSSMK